MFSFIYNVCIEIVIQSTNAVDFTFYKIKLLLLLLPVVQLTKFICQLNILSNVGLPICHLLTD